MHLVVDIGNFQIKIGFFEEDQLIKSAVFPLHSFHLETFSSLIKEKKPKHTFVSSVNPSIDKEISDLLKKENFSYKFLNSKEINLKLDVDEPDEVGHDRIANAYGALFYFPQNDCIVIDLGTAVTFDCIAKEGSYVGGAIYPGPDIGAQALAQYTKKLPLVRAEKPPSALAKTTETHIQSGLYWGLLGAIERIVDELRRIAASPSSVKILATGGATRIDDPLANKIKEEFIEDLKDLVDFIDPYLTLVGLKEILKERLKKQ